jgi:hypothetical protein
MLAYRRSGPFIVAMRIYWPKPGTLEATGKRRRWKRRIEFRQMSAFGT